jgi:hypothetical protein
MNKDALLCAFRNSLRKKNCTDNMIPLYEPYYRETIGVLSATHA